MAVDVKDLVRMYYCFCNEAVVSTVLKVGQCPPCFFLFDSEGGVHYGCMQPYDPVPQRLRMWLLSSSCNVGFVYGSVEYGPNRVAGMYCRCELSPNVTKRGRVAEVLTPINGRFCSMPEASDLLWRDSYIPGSPGPDDLPAIYCSTAPGVDPMRQTQSRLSDRGADRETVFLESVDAVIRSLLGI